MSPWDILGWILVIMLGLPLLWIALIIVLTAIGLATSILTENIRYKKANKKHQ